MGSPVLHNRICPELRILGLRVSGLGFKVLGSRVSGLGFKFKVLGYEGFGFIVFKVHQNCQANLSSVNFRAKPLTPCPTAHT